MGWSNRQNTMKITLRYALCDYDIRTFFTYISSLNRICQFKFCILRLIFLERVLRAMNYTQKHKVEKEVTNEN